MVAFLDKSTGSAGFHQIIDFINRSHICYALTKKPEVCVSFIKQFWRSVEILTDDNGNIKIHATIDGHSLSITEGSLRRHLKSDDQDGITSLPTTEIFAQLALMGYATNSDKLTFQKGAFSPQWRFLIHNILHLNIPHLNPHLNHLLLNPHLHNLPQLTLAQNIILLHPMTHLSMLFTHMEVMRVVWNSKN
ncbi:hypothetical protein Tco_0812679 [Tanacetum coccineum]